MKLLKKFHTRDVIRVTSHPLQSAEYVKYAKIFGDYFWPIFIPTEDFGDSFLLILCLLKILATRICMESFHSSVCLFLPV